MNRAQQQAALLAGLVVVMLVVYARALRGRSEAPAPGLSSAPMDAGPRDTVPLELAVSPQREAQHGRAQELGWSRDPFMHGPLAGQLSGLTLSGILWDASRPIAIINGLMLQVGDELEGHRILEIQQDRVLLSDGATTVQLLISP